MFEIRKMMVSLIEISIKLNGFSSSSVHLYHNALSNLPHNLTAEDEALDNETIASNLQTIRLDDISWPSTIFILKVDMDDWEIDVLRSAEKLFREKRIQHLILHYDTMANAPHIKEELIEHIRKVLRPRYIYIFHPNEKILYGPLRNQHLKDLSTLQNAQRPVIGLYAVFDDNISKASIESTPFDPTTFF